MTDQYCPPLPFVGSARPNTTDTNKGSVVRFDCFLGYVYPDSSTSKSIRCLGNGKWNKALPNCKRK